MRDLPGALRRTNLLPFAVREGYPDRQTDGVCRPRIRAVNLSASPRDTRLQQAARIPKRFTPAGVRNPRHQVGMSAAAQSILNLRKDLGAAPAPFCQPSLRCSVAVGAQRASRPDLWHQSPASGADLDALDDVA